METEQFMTLSQYMDNPHGKGSMFGNIEAQKKFFISKFEALIREYEMFKYKIFYSENKKARSYYMLIKVPSETVADLEYEVVIKLSPGENTVANDFTTYNVQFFSNSPSFMFTHAYTYNLHTMLINDLEHKLGDHVHTEPKIRNSYKILAFEKSIYIASLFLLRYLDDTSLINKISKKYNVSDMNKLVDTVDEKLIEYNKKKQRARSEAKKAKLELREKRNESKIEKRRKEIDSKIKTGSKIVAKAKIKPRSRIKGKPKIK